MPVAFLLNLGFSIFEFLGGIISGSFAIMSDALHDFGDALSIGISLAIEKKSRKSPDEIYTFGYGNYSLIGALFTTIVLLSGSAIIIVNAVSKILNPTEIEYGKMLIFAVIGVIVNSVAAFVTRGKDTANQRAVNLHMLEDVLGWICVLISAVVIHFSDFYVLDPIMSIAVSIFIILRSFGNLKEIFSVFLAKVPKGISVSEIKKHLMQTNGIKDVHHIHIWEHGSGTILATMHIVTDEDASKIKKNVREELLSHGINHVTLEIEKTGETLCKKACEMPGEAGDVHHLGHHHHH